MRTLGLLSLILGVGLLFPAESVQADSVGRKKKDLQKYEKKLGTQRKQLHQLSTQERSLVGELDQYARKLDRLEKGIGSLQKRTQELTSRISQTESEIGKLKGKIRSRRANIEERLRDLYIWGRPSYARALVSSRSMAELRQARWWVQRWVREDNVEIQNFRSLLESLSQKETELKTDQKEQSTTLGRLSVSKRSAKKEKGSRRKLLALVRNQKDYYEKSIAELKEAARNLQKLIETLRKEEAEGDSLFARMKGKLLLPVRGKLEKRYGAFTDKRIKTKLYHKGIDLRARAGTDVRAVFDGKVVYSGWFVGYGKVLILDHDGGYFTLYAHLSSLLRKVGNRVVVGESIGRVGDTGSIKGAYLYFELRRKGISVNPWPWFSRG